MIANREVLDRLSLPLLDIDKQAISNQDAEVFYQACAFIEDNLKNYFNWGDLKKEEIDKLKKILHKCLKCEANKTKFSFDELAARAELSSLQQQFSNAVFIDVAHNPGIQEKYLSAQLSGQEPFTSIDVKRFIVQSKMVGKIYVAEFDTRDIGLVLHQARIDHEKDKDPYTIVMMVHCGDNRWFSLNIEVNPLSNEINYKVNAGYRLSEKEKAVLETRVKEAITYQSKPDLSARTYNAFPGAAQITGLIKQTANSYHVFQQLYKTLTPLGINYELADGFAQTDTNTNAIKHFLYQSQLHAISLLPTDLARIPNQEDFVLGKLKKEVIIEELNYLIAPTVVVPAQARFVLEKVSALNFFHKKFSFPGANLRQPLSSVDYQHFITLVEQKFKKYGKNKLLEELTITCHDQACLSGLIAYNETQMPLPFKSLNLDLSPLDLSQAKVRTQFLLHLKTMLLSMSENNLQELKITDDRNQLDDKTIKELVQFIKNRAIAIDISLPERYANTLLQKTVDDSTAEQFKQRAIRQLTKLDEQNIDKHNLTDVVRKRPRLQGKQNIVVDVELQQEQQVETPLETELLNRLEAPDSSDDETIYTQEEFSLALERGQLDKGYLLFSNKVYAVWANWLGGLSLSDPITNLRISKAACEQLLQHFAKFQYGIDLERLPPGFELKTDRFGRKVLRFEENLRLIAPYDALQVQLTDAPQPKVITNSLFNQWVKSRDNSDPISKAWEHLNKQEYNKKNHQLFKKFLPQMVLLVEKDLKTLLALSFTKEGAFNPQAFLLLMEDKAKLKEIFSINKIDQNADKTLISIFKNNYDQAKEFITTYKEIVPEVGQHLLNQLIRDTPTIKKKVDALLKNQPHLGLDQLLQLYLEYGEKGIDLLTNRLNDSTLLKPELFAQLNSQVFLKSLSYAPLLTESYKMAIQAINSFESKPAEKIWWNKLLQQHAAAQSNINLVDLVNAFKKFNEKLKSYSPPLALPETCELTNVKSLPTALSRILSLIDHCKEENRVTQMAQIAKLDFSGSGVPRAISSYREDQTLAFFCPEMEISAQHETKGKPDAAVHNYFLPGLPEICAVLPKPNENHTPFEREAIEQQRQKAIKDTEMNFFRYAAKWKKNQQLSFDFYLDANEQIKKSSISLEAKNYVYYLIAGSTTGEKNSQKAIASGRAKERMRNFIKLLEETPLPSMTPESIKEKARIQILEILFRLSSIPPLPILVSLSNVICTSINNPVKIMMNAGRLQQASDDLNKRAHTYGSAVFESLKDYSDKDLENNELFFEHMEIINEIHKLAKPDSPIGNECLIGLISTFNLTKEQIAPLYADYFSDFDVNRDQALVLLQKMSVHLSSNKGSLKDKDLKAILSAIRLSPEKKVAEILKGLILPSKIPLEDYLPKGYLDGFLSVGISEKVEGIINKQFKNEQQRERVTSLLLRFKASGDASQYEAIIKKILEICEPLSNIEQNIFLDKLSSSLGLYHNPEPLVNENNSFIQLLDAIITEGSPNNFINVIAAERSLLRNMPKERKAEFFVASQHNADKVTEKLAYKTVLYLKTILPAIRTMKAQFLSTIDSTPRVLETLLKTPVAQLMPAEINNYATGFINLFKTIDTIAKKNPSSKKLFLELYDHYLQDYSSKEHGELLVYQTNFVNILEKTFALVDDANIVLSLCLQFNHKSKEELQPAGLLELIKKLDSLPPMDIKKLLKMVVLLVNNDKDYSLSNIDKLLKAIKETPEFLEQLNYIYKKPPLPGISEVLSWHDNAKESPNYSGSMQAYYNTFDKEPWDREESNGFHSKKAEEQLRHFKGFDPAGIDLAEFEQITLNMRSKTSKELQECLAGFNPKHADYKPGPVDYDTLVAVAAELLHRSKGSNEENADGSMKLGSSMEINTTQYLALLTMLKTEGHVTSQIGTGEGKSRIMMIAIACQYAQGKTVDFVTSDAQLATRDYVEFQPYFNMIGAETSMILANTDPSMYKKGGINFSDPSNLSLFRNKARSLGLGDEVIDENSENRSLLLDEADKTYFDMADTRFNFSKEADEKIQGMTWVYPLLMNYFAQERMNIVPPIEGKNTISPMELYFESIDRSREKFLEFAAAHCTEKQLLQLSALANEQIEQWQVSAVTAQQLKFKEDFVIEPDILINTAYGPKVSSEAQLLFGNRVAKSAKFSFGVHQCLQARLNIAREHLDNVKDGSLKTALEKCEQAFYIADEKQIVYSATSKNLLDDYSEGSLKAVTGTSGSMIEREEASELYGVPGKKMHFIDVPRDKGLKRYDKYVHLNKNQQQQVETLLMQIKEAREKNQPILIITENDEDSAVLFKKLNERLPNDKKIQLVHSQLTEKEELRGVSIAGVPGQITISTNMMGRGTDIALKGAAKENGLNVMVTYLPRQRDLEQIIGRSGRFGAKGETSLVLDKEHLKRALGKKTLTDGFYTHTEAYIAREQAIMDRKKQSERLIKNTVGDFRKALTDNFFNDLLKNVSKDDNRKLASLWVAFFDKSDKAWNEQWGLIQKELTSMEVNVSTINLLLKQYQTTAQQLWNTLRNNIRDLEIKGVGNQVNKKAEQLLTEKTRTLQLSEVTEKLFTKFDIKQYPLKNVMEYEHYDKGHDGRNVVYKNWYTPIIASLKGFANLLPYVNFKDARPPFANTRAWWAGRGQLFADFRASPNKGKILGALLFGILGGAASVFLILTGVLAPLGFSLSILTYLGVGATLASAAIGLAGGAVIDKVSTSPDQEPVRVQPQTADEIRGSHYNALKGLTSADAPPSKDQSDKDRSYYPSPIAKVEPLVQGFEKPTQEASDDKPNLR